MTTTPTPDPLATLAAWWDAAEVADDYQEGDLIIEDRRAEEGGFDVWPAGSAADIITAPRRILSRAPKPKPAWHDAVAVLAHVNVDGEPQPAEVFVPYIDRTTGEWESVNRLALPSDLIDPIALVPAVVTLEVRDRVWAAMKAHNGEDDRYRADYATEIDAYITAALGIE